MDRPASQQWNIVHVVVKASRKMLGFIRRPKGITLERRKKAMLIGINYEGGTKDMPLEFPRRDMKEVARLLKESFGFKDEDITILIDEVGACASEAPTRENIMRKVEAFIIPGQDNTDYVLFYSGHSGQHPEPDSNESVEEDGFMEFIIPVDEKDNEGEYLPERVIYDKYLHETIIMPLEQTKGCHLFAVMDSCHSATLLNLRHHRCNGICGAINKIRRAVRHYIVEDVLVPIHNLVVRKNATRTKRCNGVCPRVPNLSRKSTVICVSACKDSQQAVEHESATLTSAIVKLLKANPKASLKDVMYAARGVVDSVREAAKAERWPSIALFLETIKALSEWDPQLSSNDPLDTNTTLIYSDTHTRGVDRHGRLRRLTPVWERFQRINLVQTVTRYIPVRATASFHRIGNEQ